MARKTTIRVLHITGTFSSGGLESYLLNFLSLVDFEEFEHHIFVGNTDGPLEKRYRELPITIVKLKSSPKRFFYSLPFGASYCRTRGIDIIHGHNYGAYVYAYFLSLLTGIPLCTSNYGLGSWKKKRHLFMESIIFRRARVNMAISRAILEQERSLVSRAHIHPGKFQQIHPIINEAPFMNMGAYRRDTIRKKLNIDNEYPIFTIIGRIDRLKGHRIALDAMAQVNAGGPKANLLIVGALQDPLVLRENDLRRNDVTYLNYYEPIEEIWSVSDFFLIPSLSEGTPLVLVEYLALGKPIIASDIRGNADLIRDGLNGYLFKTGDVLDLATRIESVLGSGAPGNIGMNAHDLYLRTFQPRKLVREIESWYREIA
jgi:glycosyltransferase involved in cell wall biosynthesis